MEMLPCVSGRNLLMEITLLLTVYPTYCKVVPVFLCDIAYNTIVLTGMHMAPWYHFVVPYAFLIVLILTGFCFKAIRAS